MSVWADLKEATPKQAAKNKFAGSSIRGLSGLRTRFSPQVSAILPGGFGDELRAFICQRSAE
ncbi:MAG: hypothetical protein QOG23_2453 [Blastocatellia bacterium]|jgi:hypothetical protein|nr:hypothetical protein [Blastocatellia bacterium]